MEENPCEELAGMFQLEAGVPVGRDQEQPEMQFSFYVETSHVV